MTNTSKKTKDLTKIYFVCENLDMMELYKEDRGLLALLGQTINKALEFYKDEYDRCDYLQVCYGRNHRSTTQRSIVESFLFRMGKSDNDEIASFEEQNSRLSSYFLKLSYNDELVLTTFRLRNRTDYPKKAVYRANYARTNQLYLIPEVQPEIVIPEDVCYGVICFGIDKEGKFAFIGYPDQENKSWLGYTRLDEYFTDDIEPAVDFETVQPKLKISQEMINGST